MTSTHQAPAAGPVRSLLRLTLGLVALLGLVTATRSFGLGIGPQHQRRVPAAVLSPRLVQRLVNEVSSVRDSADAERLALAHTAELLHFSFRHRESTTFDRPRAGNAAEYANLFGTLFNKLARAAQLHAHAEVVRSGPVSLLGFRPTHSAFRTHEWVLISEGDNERLLDPTLHDAWLGADISRNVEGSVRGSARRVLRDARPERLGKRTSATGSSAAPNTQMGSARETSPVATRSLGAAAGALQKIVDALK